MHFREEFLRGFQEGAKLASIDAAERSWQSFSAEFELRMVHELETGGHSAGLDAGTNFRQQEQHKEDL